MPKVMAAALGQEVGGNPFGALRSKQIERHGVFIDQTGAFVIICGKSGQQGALNLDFNIRG
jgi:hypothetical protein